MTLKPYPVAVTIALAVAALTGVVLGSIVQTQINLVALVNLDVTIPPGVWLATTLRDLANFGPIYALLFLPGFVLAQLLSLALCRVLGARGLTLLCVAGAGVALLVTFTVVDALAPMPTLIAATRGGLGLILMLASAGLAGALFAWLEPAARRRVDSRHLTGLVCAVIVGGLLWQAPAVRAQESPTGQPYRITTLSDGLEYPWSLAFLPDGRMLVTERPGRLRLLDATGETRVASIAGVPTVYASGQSGLFDVRPSPQFADDRQLFLSYACGTPAANHACLARATLADERLENVQVIFRSQPAKRGDAHFGGRLAWLDDDTLILTLGDGFDYREQAQRPRNHLGSIVRLDRDGKAPPDNPFVGDDGARDAIYSIGHRNVQGLAFDAETQRLIAHEHGPRGGDEINRIEAGRNYGWPIATYGLDYTFARVTPFATYPGTIAPLLHWTPSIAPSGLAVYRGALFAGWDGDLLVGSLVEREVRRVTLSADGSRADDVESLFGELEERIRDVRVGPDGAIYLLTDSAQGRLLRVTPAPHAKPSAAP